MSFVLPILFIVLAELAFSIASRHLLTWTRVSSLPETDYRASPSMIAARAAPAVLGILGVLSVSDFAMGGWFVTAALFLYFVLRLSVVALEYGLAERGMLDRTKKALACDFVRQARFALFFSGPHLREPYHVTMWLGPLESLGFKFVVLLKERKHLRKMPKSEKYVAVLAPKPELVLPQIGEQLKAVFYVNNGMHNSSVMRALDDRCHVQLLHGDSDKPPSYHPYAKTYDRLFVAGEMAIDRYPRNGVAIPRERFRIVGRPQLRKPPEGKKGGRTVVYMTTWVGNFDDTNFSSFSQCEDIIGALLHDNDVDEVIFKPHPVTYLDPSMNATKQRVVKMAEGTGIPFRWAPRTEDPFALYAKADVLVTDISSTLIDYLYSGKPYVVTNPRGFGEARLTAFPSVSGGYLCQPDASNVADLVALALGADPMAEKRAEVQAYAFGDLDREPGEAFREACYEFLGRP